MLDIAHKHKFTNKLLIYLDMQHIYPIYILCFLRYKNLIPS